MTTASSIGSGLSSSSGSTGSASLSAGAAIGDTVFASIVLRNPSGGTVSVSDSQGNSWTQDTADSSGDSIWRSVLTTALTTSDTVSFSISGGTHSGYDIAVDTSAGGWVPDGTVPSWTAESSSTTHSASVTPPTTGDLLYSLDVSLGAESGCTTSSPFTQLTLRTGTVARGIVTAYDVAANTSSVTCTQTWSGGTHTGSMIVIAYKPASGGSSVSAAASATATGTLTASATNARLGDASTTATGSATATANYATHVDATTTATGTVSATASNARVLGATQTATVTQASSVSLAKVVGASQAATVTASASMNHGLRADASQTATVTAHATTVNVVSTEPPETALTLASTPEALTALDLAYGATVRHGLDVLDTSDVETGESLPFVSGSVTWSYRPPDPLAGQQNAVTAVRRQATLAVDGAITLNLLARRVRLWTEFLLPDGRWARWILGVFMATNPKTDDDGVVLSKQVSLADKSYLWSQTTLTDPIFIASTQAAIPWVTADLGTRFGETRFAITGDITATVGGSGLTFDSGADLLTVYSQVLEAIGNDQLTTDETGAAASQPLAVLAGKGPQATYGAGARKIVPASSIEPLVPSVPNVVRFVARQGPSSGGSEGNGIYTVTNQSTGPGSVDQRGYDVPLTVQVDAPDQATLVLIGDANKQRYFAGGGLRFTGSIGLNPTLGDQAVLSIVLPRLGMSDPAQAWIVTGWTYPLGPMTQASDALMSITAEARVP
jgi:hypothetical protein